jgi:hypothetical protein
MNPPKATGECPICGAKTYDDNTYDCTRCQSEGESFAEREAEDDARFQDRAYGDGGDGLSLRRVEGKI